MSKRQYPKVRQPKEYKEDRDSQNYEESTRSIIPTPEPYGGIKKFFSLVLHSEVYQTFEQSVMHAYFSKYEKLERNPFAIQDKRLLEPKEILAITKAENILAQEMREFYNIPEPRSGIRGISDRLAILTVKYRKVEIQEEENGKFVSVSIADRVGMAFLGRDRLAYEFTEQVQINSMSFSQALSHAAKHSDEVLLKKIHYKLSIAMGADDFSFVQMESHEFSEFKLSNEQALRQQTKEHVHAIAIQSDDRSVFAESRSAAIGTTFFSPFGIFHGASAVFRFVYNQDVSELNPLKVLDHVQDDIIESKKKRYEKLGGDIHKLFSFESIRRERSFSSSSSSEDSWMDSSPLTQDFVEKVRNGDANALEEHDYNRSGQNHVDLDHTKEVGGPIVETAQETFTAIGDEYQEDTTRFDDTIDSIVKGL